MVHGSPLITYYRIYACIQAGSEGDAGLPAWYMGAALLLGFLVMMAMQAASEAMTHGARA